MGRNQNHEQTCINRFIAATGREILQDAGKVTAEITHGHAEGEIEKMPQRAGSTFSIIELQKHPNGSQFTYI